MIHNSVYFVNLNLCWLLIGMENYLVHKSISDKISMVDEYYPLSSNVVKNLLDKLYEKRKSAAIDIEKLFLIIYCIIRFSII